MQGFTIHTSDQNEDMAFCIQNILHAETPALWLENVLQNMDTLLLDHAHAERKAAQTALKLLHHYPASADFVDFLVKTAREEMQHLSQVLQLLKKNHISYKVLKPCRYGSVLLSQRRQHDPQRFLDSLIIAALIEARSCERFSKLVAILPHGIAKFYQGLVACEENHFKQYLYFAQRFFSQDELLNRLIELAKVEAECVLAKETLFRFHSGVPSTS